MFCTSSLLDLSEEFLYNKWLTARWKLIIFKKRRKQSYNYFISLLSLLQISTKSTVLQWLRCIINENCDILHVPLYFSNPSCDVNWPPADRHLLNYQLIEVPGVYINTQPSPQELDMIEFYDKIDQIAGWVGCGLCDISIIALRHSHKSQLLV